MTGARIGAIRKLFSGYSGLWASIMLGCCIFLAGSGFSSPLLARPASHSNSALANRLTASQGCGHASPVTPGTSADQTFAVNPAEALDQHTRLYRVHIPSAYHNNLPTPLVLYLHGAGGTAAGEDRNSGFTALAEQDNFIVVYGQGLPDAITGQTFWADVGPIDYGIDDVHAVNLMLDDLQNKFCIDPHRIFATGFSSGGGMSNMLSCRLANRIAAVAPVSGNFYTIPGGCHPSRPISVLNIHGTADALLPYNGFSPDLDPSWPLPPIPQWLQEWAGRDGCNPAPQVFLHTPQVMGEQWTGCQDGTAIVHYRIEGGGHSWPGPLAGRPFQAIIWNFFQAHPIP
ncbi:MAG TPA: PHB depolymerase family esterase [Ktedonobacteraceae bacterium]|nr:PHB depolymerase family esterase [Ktedonobacteraceae bacterium]